MQERKGWRSRDRDATSRMLSRRRHLVYRDTIIPCRPLVLRLGALLGYLQEREVHGV
jgi:hypothetical protein